MVRLAAGRVRVGFLAALLTGFLSACASKDFVVVVPDRDGAVGQVTVSTLDGTATEVLDTAYEAAEVSETEVSTSAVSEQEVEKTFAGALAARPIPPRAFLLYFESDSEELTAESIAKFEDVFADIARRPAYEVEVVGHTDRAADDSYNDPLSQARAERIRAMLIDRGLDPDVIIATGRGERDPAVPTPDGVHEPRNRRVEIDVR